MGSGSFGGLGGGGGGGGSAIGGYRSEGGKMISSSPSLSKVEEEVATILRNLSKEQVSQMFCSPMIRDVYEFIFEVAVQVFQNRSWKALEDRFGTSVGPGLRQWITAVIGQWETQESNRDVRANARLVLEDFLLRALGNDESLFKSGTGEQILAGLDQKIFDRTSNHFLAFLCLEVVRGKLEAPAPATEHHVITITKQLADRIVANFESKFYAKGQTTYRDLFRIVQENLDWFRDQLRK